LSHHTDWAIIRSMSDADPRSSDKPIPGNSPDTSLPIPGTSDVSNDPCRSTPEYLQPPRLGIIHLLAWMTVTAVLFKIIMALAPGRPFEMSYSLCIWIFKVIINSAAITGAGIVLVAKYHGGKGYYQPGHFLLFYSSLVTLANLALSRLFSLSMNPVDNDLLGFSPFIWTFPGVIIFFWIASKIPEQGRWKYMFRAWGWISLLIFVFGDIPYSYGSRSQFLIFQMILFFIFMLPVAILLMVATLDLIRGSRRDWLHWLGIGVSVLNIVWAPTSMLIHTFSR
jgi:hypothetical protein